MKNPLVILAAAALILGSCNSMKKTSAQTNNTTTASTSNNTLTGSWELDHVPNPNGTFEQLYATRKPRITFNENETSFNGFTGCNTFNGKVEINTAKQTIHFNEDMMSTKMACPGDGEKILLDNLKKINQYSISKDGLQLTLIQGDIARMHFRKMAQ